MRPVRWLSVRYDVTCGAPSRKVLEDFFHCPVALAECVPMARYGRRPASKRGGRRRREGEMLSAGTDLRTKGERNCRQRHGATAIFTKLALLDARSWGKSPGASPGGFCVIWRGSHRAAGGPSGLLTMGSGRMRGTALHGLLAAPAAGPSIAGRSAQQHVLHELPQGKFDHVL